MEKRENPREKREREKQWTLKQDVNAVTFSDYIVLSREGAAVCSVDTLYMPFTGPFYLN